MPVTFENNDLSRPMVLGHLFSDNESITACSPVFNSLEVKYDTVLGSNTSIGEVTAEHIKALVGIKENIQQQINQMKNEISFLQDEITTLKKS